MGQGDTLINAIIGAVVTVVLSFTGFSPLLGGGVAGYLQRGERMDGVRVGAISGVVATLPFLLLGFFAWTFFFAVPVMDGGMGGMAGGFGIVFFLIIFLFAFTWNVILSAIGGYLGVYIAMDTDIGR